MRSGIGFISGVSVAAVLGSMLLACGGVDSVVIPRADSDEPTATGPTGGKGATDAGKAFDSGVIGAGDVDSGVSPIDAGITELDVSQPPAPDAGPPAPPPPATLAQITAITSTCAIASTTPYAPHDGVAPYVNICKLNGAYFWTSELRIDCDGQTSSECKNGPYFQPQTALHQSDGKMLDAATLPYVVIPENSDIFNFTKAGVGLGDVVLVVYGGQMAYAIIGDTGPDNVIGSGSYALAQTLGMNPDPTKGGTSGGVTYVAFTGPSSVPAKVEDHNAAVTLGQALSAQLVANNPTTTP